MFSPPAGFTLCVLEHVNVFGYALDLEVVELHIIMQLQEVEGVSSGAPRLEVVKEVLWGDLGVNKVGVS